MKKIETFLSLYKEYETIMRDRGIDCKTAEDQSDDITSNRLRMCRLTRNYLSHQNDAGFLEISDAQIKFLQDYVNNLKSQDDIVKKHLKTPAAGSCLLNTRCGDVLVKMIKGKLDTFVGVTDNGYVLFSWQDIVAGYMESKTTSLLKVKSKKLSKFVSPTMKFSEMPEGVLICTDNGAKDGNFIGVLYN